MKTTTIIFFARMLSLSTFAQFPLLGSNQPLYPENNYPLIRYSDSLNRLIMLSGNFQLRAFGQSGVISWTELSSGVPPVSASLLNVRLYRNDAGVFYVAFEDLSSATNDIYAYDGVDLQYSGRV